MSEQKKEGRFVWVKIQKTYAGPEGMFAKGETRQMSQSLVQKLKKQIHPKSVTNPVNANIDMDRVRLSDAQDKLNTAQADLNQCRIHQAALLNKKTLVEDELAQHAKLKTEDLEKPGILNRLHRKAKANLEIVELDIEQVVDDIKEHVAATEKLVVMIEEYRQAIEDKNRAPEEETDDESDETKTGPDDGQAKKNADTRG